MHCLSLPRQNILHSPNLLYHPFQLFQSQDLACVLIVLYAAVEQFGAPQCLITDNGGVFRAKQLLRRWKLYGEEALARHPTVIWLPGDALTVEYQETPLARGHRSLSTR
jgi:hypothetical protein